MDDPMIRSRLGRINGTRPLGALDPKQEPLFFCVHFARLLLVGQFNCGRRLRCFFPPSMTIVHLRDPQNPDRLALF